MAQEKKAANISETLTEAQKEMVEMGRPMKLKYNAKGDCRSCKTFKTLMKPGLLGKPCRVCELGNKFTASPHLKKFKKIETPTATLNVETN